MDTRTRTIPTAPSGDRYTQKPPRVLPAKFQAFGSRGLTPPSSPKRQPLVQATNPPPSPSRLPKLLKSSRLVDSEASQSHYSRSGLQSETQWKDAKENDEVRLLDIFGLREYSHLTDPSQMLVDNDRFSVSTLMDALPHVRTTVRPDKPPNPNLDIGTYDGGLDFDEDIPNKNLILSSPQRKILALDSSIGFVKGGF